MADEARETTVVFCDQRDFGTPGSSAPPTNSHPVKRLHHLGAEPNRIARPYVFTHVMKAGRVTCMCGNPLIGSDASQALSVGESSSRYSHGP
jgi:hypothetical protein